MGTGQELVDILNTRKGDKYILGAFAPKDNASFHGPWDCAELCAWGIYQVSSKLYGCVKNDGPAAKADSYTGYFNRDAHKLGKIIPVDQASRTPGAFLLRIAGDGSISHIVCCVGVDSKTIEAHGHADGVVNLNTTGRGWDFGILVPWIEYNENQNIVAPVALPQSKIYRFTTPVMVLPIIGQIQHKLSDLGFYHGPIDNIYGKGTYLAVKGFQNSHGLMPDGEVGPKTLKLLNL